MAPTNDKKLQCLLFAPPSIGSFECMGGKKYGLDTSAAVALFINYRHGSTCGDLKMRILMDRDHASYATDWSENGQAPVVPRHNIRITWDDMEFVKVKAIRVNSETHAKVLPREFVAASIAKNKIKWTHLRVKLTDAFRVGAGQRKLQFRQWAFLNCGEFNFLLEGHAVIASLRRFDRATFVREQERTSFGGPPPLNPGPRYADDDDDDDDQDIVNRGDVPNKDTPDAVALPLRPKFEE